MDSLKTLSLCLIALAYGPNLGRSAEVPAAPAELPLQDFAVVSGYVYASAVADDVLYLGGLFTGIGPRAGSGVVVDAANGERRSGFPAFNGETFAILPDDGGGWIVGGSRDG